jgi:DNA-binding MarR family transcriptional regulator
MNHFMFALKRAHQVSLRLGQQLVAPFGLTPARFDLMYQLMEGRGRHRPIVPRRIAQSDLRKRLGVTAATTSRMLRSLEDLGLVLRTRPDRWEDRRQRLVELTERGYRAMCAAVHETMTRGLVWLALDSVVLGPRWNCEWRHLEVFDTLDVHLTDLRRGLGDTARIYYRWHPDD